MTLLLFLTFFAEGLTLTSHGSLGDETLFLSAGAKPAVDDRDTLYLLDPGEFKVRVFDHHLNPVGEFGRKGQGPGEFEEPKAITITPDQHPAVFDPTLKRLTVFDRAGSVLRMHRLDAASMAVYQPAVLSKNRIAFLSARAHQGQPVYDLSLYSADASLIKNLERLKVPSLDWSKSNDPQFWVSFLTNELNLIGQGLPVMCAISGNRLVYARSHRYQLHLVNAEGDLLKTIARQVRPKPFSPQHRDALFKEVWHRLTTDPYLFEHMPRPVFERAAARADQPETLPIIHAVTRWRDGLAVLSQYDGTTGDGTFDFFNGEGEFLGSAPYHGHSVQEVASGLKFLYVMGSQQDDLVKVTRLHLQ